MSRTPNLTANGNCTVAAGETLSISIVARATAGGAYLDLTGRTYALTVYHAGDQTELQTVTTTAAGTSAALVMQGDLFRTWLDTLPGEALRIMLAEILAPSGSGAPRIATITDGSLTINKAPRTFTANASTATSGGVIQVVCLPNVAQIQLGGAPGLKGDPSFDWTPNFIAPGSVYIPALVAMTIDAGNPPIGSGTLAYAKSTTAAPGTFTSTTLPATLQAGAWLQVTASNIVGFVSAHLRRTA